MKIPARLEPLVGHSLIDDVVFQLMSGKEAEVYVVRSGAELRCAKVYKDTNNRSFKHITQYTEGRMVRNSRQARAMNNKSRYGRKETESEWQRTEVDTLSLLAGVGVRVPQSYAFIDGVLIMEMICDEHGNPAPRLHEVDLTAENANLYFLSIIRDVVRMLCAGIVHGDLSEFNVLLSHEGPVIIDFPQAVQATSNSAFSIFERDIDQLKAYFGKFSPDLLSTQYAKEIWQMYKKGELRSDSPLTGRFVTNYAVANLDSVFESIQGAFEDEQEKRGIRKDGKRYR